MKTNVFKQCLGLAAICAAILGSGSMYGENNSATARVAVILKAAEKADTADNYPTAAKRYLDALAVASAENLDSVPELKKKLADTYVNWARTLYWKARTDKDPIPLKQAIALCHKASEANPSLSRKCDVFIEKFQKDMKSLEYQQATSLETIDPNRSQRLEKIATLIRQGEQFAKDNQFSKALEKFNDALAIDPYNLQATLNAKKMLKEITRIGRERRGLTEQSGKAEVEWKNVKTIAKRRAAMEEAARRFEAKQKFGNKLEQTLISRIAFKNTPFAKALALLQTEIAKALGNNFKFKYQGFSPEDDTKWPPITFHAKNIPANAAIKAICNAMALEATYTPDNTVVLKPK